MRRGSELLRSGEGKVAVDLRSSRCPTKKVNFLENTLLKNKRKAIFGVPRNAFKEDFQLRADVEYR
jgi:hypothetical protein